MVVRPTLDRHIGVRFPVSLPKLNGGHSIVKCDSFDVLDFTHEKETMKFTSKSQIRTCPKCKKKCWIDGTRQIQSMWFCPNPFCREPMKGINGEPNTQHPEYPYTIHQFPELGRR